MLFFGCKGEMHNEYIKVIDLVSAVWNMVKIDLSQFTTDVRYIPMESIPQTPLRWTYRNYSCFTEDYILDSDGEICILYDKYGHFIRQIGKEGRGPGEYAGIGQLFLTNNRAYVHDFFNDDLIEYNLDGTLIQKYKRLYSVGGKYININHGTSILINDSLIFVDLENFTGHDEYKSVLINKNGSIERFYKNYIFFDLAPKVQYANAPGKANIIKYGNSIFFKELLNDTLFQIDSNYDITPKYVFHLGKFNEPLSERGKDWSQIDLQSYITLAYVIPINDFLILGCALNKYFPVKRIHPEIIRLPSGEDYTSWYNTASVIGFYNTKSGDLKFSEPTSTDNHLSTSGFYNDIDAGPRFFPDKKVNDSTLIMKIRFDHLLQHIESNEFKNFTPKYPGKKKRLEILVDSLKKIEYQEPIYMLVTFRNS